MKDLTSVVESLTNAVRMKEFHGATQGDIAKALALTLLTYMTIHDDDISAQDKSTISELLIDL
jgi:hypothetical protein